MQNWPEGGFLGHLDVVMQLAATLVFQHSRTRLAGDTKMTNALADASRRRLLVGLSALGVGLALSPKSIAAQSPSRPAPNPRRLDLHHHFGSPRWIKRAADAKRQGWEAFQE